MKRLKGDMTDMLIMAKVPHKEFVKDNAELKWSFRKND